MNKRLARTFGQDLMRGEHVVGGGGARVKENLTWVKGDRDPDRLDETSRKILAAQPQSGTSIFDPVLCELIYRWFCPPGGTILDPFAGGSVRGIVAAKLGRNYTGIELRGEQIEANREQATIILANNEGAARWIQGDARDCKALTADRYDLVFTCPPYGDLEVYSDDPADLSNMPFDEFIVAYRQAIAAARETAAQERERLMAETMADPVRFARAYLADDPTDMQAELMRACAVRNARVAVRGCHASSKTHAAAMVVIWFISNFSDGIAMTMAPVDRQVEGVTLSDDWVAHNAGNCRRYKHRTND